MQTFDYMAIISLLLKIVGGVGGVYACTALLKHFPQIPWVNKDNARMVAGVLSAASTVIIGYGDQNVQPTDIQHLLVAVLTFASMWGGSHATHAALQDETPPANT